MARRVLFVIRGKLGDTLLAYAVVQRWRERHPDDRITVLTRADYASLLAGDDSVEIVGVGKRDAMIARLFLWRLLRSSFDIAAVLWGAGPEIEWFGRLVRARRKLCLDDRFARWIPEWPAPLAFADLESRADPAWRVARLIDPELPRPDRLRSLALQAACTRAGDATAPVGLVPVADEARRCLDADALAALLDWAGRQWPRRPRCVIVNPNDPGAGALRRIPLPAGVEWREFATLGELLAIYRELGAWAGTDTGLYHLAAAAGLPATVFFGPTEPLKVVLPGQPAARGIRLAVLGNEHCEVKDCRTPVCLDRAVALAAGRVGPELALAPADCPLHAHATAALSRLACHENPRHQA